MRVIANCDNLIQLGFLDSAIVVRISGNLARLLGIADHPIFEDPFVYNG